MLRCSTKYLKVKARPKVQTEKRADYPKCYRQAEEKLAREQRKLSHCGKRSRNYAKQKKRVAKVHEKIRNQRRDCDPYGGNWGLLGKDEIRNPPG